MSNQEPVFRQTSMKIVHKEIKENKIIKNYYIGTFVKIILILK